MSQNPKTPKLQRPPPRVQAAPTRQLARPTGSREDRPRGWAWMQTRERVFERDGWQCVACRSVGRIGPAVICDHRMPRVDGGADTDDNLQSLCNPCSDGKTAAEEAMRARGERPTAPLTLQRDGTWREPACEALEASPGPGAGQTLGGAMS